VVAIGTDCPEVTRRDVESARAALARHDLVTGPATDGGYWLIGLSQNRPELFHGIDWSTDRVHAQTLRTAEAGGLTCHRLRMLADVDTLQDWKGFLHLTAAMGMAQAGAAAHGRAASPSL